jgi:hypothetical protein
MLKILQRQRGLIERSAYCSSGVHQAIQFGGFG